MRAICVSDLHLAGPDCPRQAAFLAFLRTLACDQLCLCGDIFQHWWHWPDGRVFPEYAPVVDALLRFSLVVLPGNHDFAAPAYFAERGAIAPDPSGVVQVNWDSRRVVLAHGDQADTSVGYRALSAVLRGRGFAGVINRQPPSVAWRWLGKLVGRGESEPNPALVRAQVVWAQQRDADVVIYGHTHVAGVHPGQTTAVNIGDHRTFVEWCDGRPNLREFADPLHCVR